MKEALDRLIGKPVMVSDPARSEFLGLLCGLGNAYRIYVDADRWSASITFDWADVREIGPERYIEGPDLMVSTITLEVS